MYNRNNIVLYYRVFQSRHMAPLDPAGPGEQGRDQQSVHDEAEVEEKKVEEQEA